jgi:hypothetical protein
MLEIKYTSFALPPYGIKPEKKYLFGKDSDGCFYSSAKEKKYLPLDEIKVLFSPVDKTWDEALKIPKAKKEN